MRIQNLASKPEMRKSLGRSKRREIDTDLKVDFKNRAA
jgi:hypothetical protein